MLERNTPKKKANNVKVSIFAFQIPVVARAPVRTLSDGPTTRQKILVVSIWLFSSLFGFLTCFPDKFVHGTEESNLVGGPKGGFKGQNSNSGGPSSIRVDATEDELSYCSVKNGVNDMLDYIALVVALVAPLIIGPCIVGVFQVIISSFFML